MPVIPKVFIPIRSNDVTVRPFKAYKNYRIRRDDFLSDITASVGHRRHGAHYKRYTPHIFGHTGLAVGTRLYEINDEDNTNAHVIWNGLDHRYYRYPYDPARTHELSDITKVTKYLAPQAHSLTLPYFDVGERIKPSSVTGSFCYQLPSALRNAAATSIAPDSTTNPNPNDSFWTYQIKLANGHINGNGASTQSFHDDGFGNLIDEGISTSSFASSSHEILYLSFNNEYRNTDSDTEFGRISGPIEYIRNKRIEKATPKGVFTAEGIALGGTISGGMFPVSESWSGSDAANIVRLWPSESRYRGNLNLGGLSGRFSGSRSYIHIPNHSDFDRFSHCDDWTISFWIKREEPSTEPASITASQGHTVKPIITKYGVRQEDYYDPIDAVIKQREVNLPTPPISIFQYDELEGIDNHQHADWSQYRTPFAIGVEQRTETSEMIYHFHQSDGTDSLHISASDTNTRYAQLFPITTTHRHWQHVTVRHSASICQILLNGTPTGTSGSLPKGPITNNADVMIGSTNTEYVERIPNEIPAGGLPGNVGAYITSYNGSTCKYSIVEGDLTINSFFIIRDGAVVIVHGDLIVNDALWIIDGKLIVYGTIFESDADGPTDDDLADNIQVFTGGQIINGYDHTENSYDLAEIRMYKYAVNDTGVKSLSNRHFHSGSLFQSNVMGNVFYRNGQIVLSSPMPKHHFSHKQTKFLDKFQIEYKGQHTLYENQVFVRVPADELNVSLNPTATYAGINSDDGKPCEPNQVNAQPGEFIKDMFISGTAFPYITQIGLYNDNMQMLAVGKLSQPIQKRDDVDMNFIVRWDY